MSGTHGFPIKLLAISLVINCMLTFERTVTEPLLSDAMGQFLL